MTPESTLKRPVHRAVIGVVIGCLAACGGAVDFDTGAGPASEIANTCATITAVPDPVAADYRLDRTFYARYCAVYGVPVLATAGVADGVVQEAARLASAVLGGTQTPVRDAIHDRFLRIVVIASSQGEQFEDVPEFDDLYPQERAAAGLGPTVDFPAVVVRDDVIECRPQVDRPFSTPPGDTLVHELGHALLSMGLIQLPGAFGAHLLLSFERARAADTWRRTIPAEVANLAVNLPQDEYMMTNPDEYFAVAVSSYVGFKAITIGYQVRRISASLVGVGEQTIVGAAAIAAHDPQLGALLQQALPALEPPVHHCPEWLESF